MAPPRGGIILPHGRSSVQGASEYRTEIPAIRSSTTIAAFEDPQELGGVIRGFVVFERIQVGSNKHNFALRLPVFTQGEEVVLFSDSRGYHVLYVDEGIRPSKLLHYLVSRKGRRASSHVIFLSL